MDKKALLSTLTFGERVAEEETDDLATYFVETDDWGKLHRDAVDVVYGPKGAGKSALYALLMSRASSLRDRGVLLIAAENPRGATAFRHLAERSDSTETELVGFWKLYLLSLLHGSLTERGFRSPELNEVADVLQREGLVKGNTSLSGLLRAVLSYVRAALRPGAIEGGLDIDPLTQLPRGFRGKIVFAEPSKPVAGSDAFYIDHLLQLASDALRKEGLAAWIAHDRLDVAFADASDIEARALRALFRVYLDLKAFDAIRLKIFLRTDVWTRITEQGFREGSHITRQLTISWNRNSLLNLIVRRLLHNGSIRETFHVDHSLAQSSTTDQEVFLRRLCPAQVDQGPTRPATFDWILTRTKDGSNLPAPREVIHFFNSLRDVQAKKFEIGESDPPDEILFDRSSFPEALREVSRIRLHQTLYAEYPALKASIEGLRGGTTQYTAETLAAVWSIAPDESAARAKQLLAVGFFEELGTRRSPEYRIPFLYRDALDLDQEAAKGSGGLSGRLRQYLVPHSPLGPSDAAQITDVEVAACLFDPHNQSFNSLLRRDLSILLGRRGSGKTALLNSYSYRPYIDRYERPSSADARFDFRSYEIVISVVTYRQFDQMQLLVTKDGGSFRPIEAVIDDWAALILDYSFARLVVGEFSRQRLTDHLTLVHRYLSQNTAGGREEAKKLVWGDALRSSFSRLELAKSLADAPEISQADALAAVSSHLSATGTRVVVLFDSMDEYDIANPVFVRSLGALLRFISQFNSQHERIKIKLALPSEIFPEVQRASANPLKDLVSFEQLTWTPIELAQLAAHRYRLFLSLYDVAFSETVGHLDLNRRDDLALFWSRFLPQRHVNSYGHDEIAMTYILRHTHLLPRQFLMILQKVVVLSAVQTGGFRRFTTEAVDGALETMVHLIANEIFGAYSHIYPFARVLCAPIFASYPTVFSFEELEDRWRKKGRPVARGLGLDFETPQLGEMLLRMGIVGICQAETDLYCKATFGYDSLSPINVGDGHRLCLHPIFERHLSASGNPRMKAILPVGAGIQWV